MIQEPADQVTAHLTWAHHFMSADTRRVDRMANLVVRGTAVTGRGDVAPAVIKIRTTIAKRRAGLRAGAHGGAGGWIGNYLSCG